MLLNTQKWATQSHITYASEILSLFDHILKHVGNNKLLSAMPILCWCLPQRRQKVIWGSWGSYSRHFKGFQLQQQCSKPPVTIKHWCELFRILLISNYPNSMQETWHPVFLLTSMDLMFFRLWSSPSTTLIHPCSAMTPRKTESGKETPKPRKISNEYLVVDLMCDVGKQALPLVHLCFTTCHLNNCTTISCRVL